jgi:hypothetical protein
MSGAAKVVPAEVIDEDENDVGRGRFFSGRGTERSDQRNGDGYFESSEHVKQDYLLPSFPDKVRFEAK